MAEVENAVAGYICALTRSDARGRIYSLAVDREYRGRGIAELLLGTALDFLRGSGMRAVFLEVAVDNAPAIALYEKKGFVKRSIKRRYYLSGADAHSMALSFTPRD